MSDEFDYQLEYQRLALVLEDFAKDPEDTAMMCLLRLVAEYHDLMGEKMWDVLERERTKNK